MVHFYSSRRTPMCGNEFSFISKLRSTPKQPLTTADLWKCYSNPWREIKLYFIRPRFDTLPQHSTLSLLYSALCGAWHRWQQEGGMGAFSRFFAIVSCSSVTMTFFVSDGKREMRGRARTRRPPALSESMRTRRWPERWDCFLRPPFQNTASLRLFKYEMANPLNICIPRCKECLHYFCLFFCMIFF